MSDRWFYYLKNSEINSIDSQLTDKRSSPEEGRTSSSKDSSERKRSGIKKKALLDVFEPAIKTLFVCVETKKRLFRRFPTYFDFAKYVKSDVKDVNNCFYELIFGELPQKPYFDCECARRQSGGVKLEDALKIEGVPNLPQTELRPRPPKFELDEAEADAAIVLLKSCIRKVCSDIRDEDVMIFSSHGSEKLSYHIVIDHWCCADVNDNRALHDKVMEIYPSKYRELVDHGVYTSIRQFRIYRSHKYQSERTKLLSHLSTWRPQSPHEDKDHEFIQILGASLVSNASYCKLLPSFRPPPKPKPTYDGVETLLEATDIDKAIELATTAHKTSKAFPFKIGEIKGGLITLRRLAPSFCQICQRVHEHENPYLTVVGPDRKVYFYCRRADKSQKLLVGSLGPRPEAIEQFVSYPFDENHTTPKSAPTVSPLPKNEDILPLPEPSIEVTVSMKPHPQMSKAVLPGVSGISLAVHMQTLQTVTPRIVRMTLPPPSSPSTIRFNIYGR